MGSYCNVEAATDIEYFILPVAGLGLHRLLALQEQIETFAGESSKVYSSKRRGNPKPGYWVARLHESGYRHLHDLSEVCVVDIALVLLFLILGRSKRSALMKHI